MSDAIPRNHLMYQALALCMSELNQHTSCTVSALPEESPIGTAAFVELAWGGPDDHDSFAVTRFVSRHVGPETLQLAAQTAAEVTAWLEERGWHVRSDAAPRPNAGAGYQADLWRAAPIPLIPAWMGSAVDETIVRALAPYLAPASAERACLLIHEYSYETRGGVAITDEVALQWGKQTRVLRSSTADHLSAVETAFTAGETYAAGAVAYLLTKGWTFETRDRHLQAASTLSNITATNVTVTFSLRKKKRFGLF